MVRRAARRGRARPSTSRTQRRARLPKRRSTPSRASLMPRCGARAARGAVRERYRCRCAAAALRRCAWHRRPGARRRHRRRAGLGARDAGAVRTARDRRPILDRAIVVRTARSRGAQSRARSRARVRYRVASDDATVPRMARRARVRRAVRCSTTAAAPAFSRSPPRSSARDASPPRTSIRRHCVQPRTTRARTASTRAGRTRCAAGTGRTTSSLRTS